MPKVLGPYPVRAMIYHPDGPVLQAQSRRLARTGSATGAVRIARAAGYDIQSLSPVFVVDTNNGPEWHVRVNAST